MSDEGNVTLVTFWDQVQHCITQNLEGPTVTPSSVVTQNREGPTVTPSSVITQNQARSNSDT